MGLEQNKSQIKIILIKNPIKIKNLTLLIKLLNNIN